jgi:hypothetical protein
MLTAVLYGALDLRSLALAGDRQRGIKVHLEIT